MDERAWLTERFEEHRTRLRAVAYRMLGSLSEADDAVQDAWLRVSRADTSSVENLAGWLTTVVARVCLNMLRKRESRREEPLDVHIPDPIISREDRGDPEQEALLADSVGLALLVVLDTLTPAERLAFVLHDMFAVPFEEIAPMIERSPAAARQLASRARRRVQGAAPAPDPDLSAPARCCRRVLRRCPRRKLRRAHLGAPPRRRATCRRRPGARPPDRRDPRRASRGRTSGHRHAARSVRATGVDQRSRRSRRRCGRPVVLGHGLHCRAREDRQYRRALRPRTPGRSRSPRSWMNYVARPT